MDKSSVTKEDYKRAIVKVHCELAVMQLQPDWKKILKRLDEILWEEK